MPGPLINYGEQIESFLESKAGHTVCGKTGCNICAKPMVPGRHCGTKSKDKILCTRLCIYVYTDSHLEMYSYTHICIHTVKYCTHNILRYDLLSLKTSDILYGYNSPKTACEFKMTTYTKLKKLQQNVLQVTGHVTPINSALYPAQPNINRLLHAWIKCYFFTWLCLMKYFYFFVKNNIKICTLISRSSVTG
jgi:hypothetical protein